MSDTRLQYLANGSTPTRPQSQSVSASRAWAESLSSSEQRWNLPTEAVGTEVYVGKEYWCMKTSEPCLHCHGPISYRPIPIGYEEKAISGSIMVRSPFCSWPCARHYASHYYNADFTEQLTTKIMSEFKQSLSPGDDPDGWEFLQHYDRFSQIPAAPPTHEFVPYGRMSHSAFRSQWVALGQKRPSSIGMVNPGTCTDVLPMDATPECDATPDVSHILFRNGYSAKKPFRSNRWAQQYGWWH